VLEREAGVKHAAPRRSLARLLGRGVIYGTLWGLGITASEVLVLPFGQFESLAELGANFGQIFVNWCVDGSLIACGTLAIERRLDRSWKVATAIAVAAVMAAAINSTGWAVAQWLGVSIPPRLIGESLPSWANALYGFWMALFYGGLFIIACVLLSRTERTRFVLGEAQIARDKTELLLDKAEIESLYGQVEPAFLIRAMRVVRDRYASDAASADQLLDDLVAFLRLAMPGVRSGSSTLAAELQLAQSYAQLQRAIDPERVAWHVDAEASLPEMPFPPLVLLPLLDAVVTPAKAGPLTLRTSLHRASQRVVLAILTPPGAARAVVVPAALRYRLRVALQATLGDAWRIADQSSDTTLPDTMALALYIDARPSAPVPAPAPPVKEPHAASLADMAAVLHELRAASLLAPGALR
jgi:hypothetical protein